MSSLHDETGRRCARHRLRRACRHEQGAVAIMFAGGLVLILAFLALSLDLSRLYNRKMEMQNVADTVALAAAMELNGTDQGITNALDKAADRFVPALGALTYQYGNSGLTWDDNALKVGPTPNGPWQSANSAKGSADGFLYVSFDTADLGDSYGAIDTIFLRYFRTSTTVSTSARAVAGHSALKVTPLGICAMRDEPQRNHNGDLEEFGFRRGIVYNLLELSRDPAASKGDIYLINPQPGTVAVTDTAKVAPFICTGTMAMARVTGGSVIVTPNFPLASLYYHLNSRFGNYSAPSTPCNARQAPPDANIKEYTYSGGTPWMGTTQNGQSALLHISDRRWTIAGPDVRPASAGTSTYGPLWSYAKAARFDSYTALGKPEPADGYTTFAPSDWTTLYFTGLKASTATPYPTDPKTPTPYSYSSGTTFFKIPPTGTRGIRNRRVLNLPLLACPVSGNRAQIVGIGKFFMPVSATANSLYGEFAGLVPEQSLRTQVELYP